MFPPTVYRLGNCPKNRLFRLPDFAAIWPCDADTGKGSARENRSQAQARPDAPGGARQAGKAGLIALA
jgi:hypothetical protein